jgi:hypothetical protein
MTFLRIQKHAILVGLIPHALLVTLLVLVDVFPLRQPWLPLVLQAIISCLPGTLDRGHCAYRALCPCPQAVVVMHPCSPTRLHAH